MNETGVNEGRGIQLEPVMAVNMDALDEKLYSNRLLLRRVRKEDLCLLVEWSQSRVSCGEFLSPEYYDRYQVQQKLDGGVYWNRNEKLFFIEKRDGLPLGTIHYWQAAGKIDSVVVAVKIADPQERRKGYGTEAQKSLIIYLFERMKAQSVEMYIDVDNVAQQRCLGRLGFQFIESLTYDDKDVKRLGNLYQLDAFRYHQEPIYRYHYE